MTLKKLTLSAVLSALMFPSIAVAQMSQSEALKEVERQLNVWKSQGRYEEIKIISKYNTSVIKQVKAGKIDLQAIVDMHNYGQSSPKRETQSKPSQQRPNIGNQPIATNASSRVPVSNKPVAAYTRLEQSWTGFPAVLTYKAHLGLAFPNGNFVSCSNWDPAVLSPTPESVGRAVKGCEVLKARGEGKKAKEFSKGQTINIKFGNVSANGFDWGNGSSSQISGSNLIMTNSGRIAVGKFRGTSVSSGGNGVGTSARSRPLVGTYALDGHIITITTNKGEVINGFIAWTSNSNSSKIDHIYLNGEHFWNRKT